MSKHFVEKLLRKAVRARAAKERSSNDVASLRDMRDDARDLLRECRAIVQINMRSESLS